MVVGEDQPITRQGVVSVLAESGFEVVGVTGDAADLIRKSRAHKPDVIIADIRMPPGNADDGFRAALQIRSEQPEVGVLIFSQYLDAGYALELVGDRAGGVGYLLKERVGEVSFFTDAVLRVARGGSALDPEVVEGMVGRPRRRGPLADLTPREREVLGLIAEGRSNVAIAERLTVTVGAVERHVTNIFDRLGLRSAPEDHRRVLAVLEYLKS